MHERRGKSQSKHTQMGLAWTKQFREVGLCDRPRAPFNYVVAG